MTFRFDESIRAGVLGHMNGDHGDDNLLIVRAFGSADDVTAATMTDLDGEGGVWEAEDAAGSVTLVRVPWPNGPISQRPEVRAEIVALYDLACARLGVEPRPHD